LAPTSVTIVQEIEAEFGNRRGNDIAPSEWKLWVDGDLTARPPVKGRMTGRSAATRERFLGTTLAFLHYAVKHHGFALERLPSFTRDKAARNPNRRKRRRVGEMRPDLIQLLFDCAHITLRAQLAVVRCTGARVSSIIYAARVCDLVLGSERSHITFPKTKNGVDATAALDKTAVAVLKDYLLWRGNLHDRESPLFLTYRRKPYIFNGRRSGGQTKTGFRAAKRRACAALIEKAERLAAEMRKRGRNKAADETLAAAKADAALLSQVTPHWFRHRLATLMVRRDPRAAMEQGGWLDMRSVFGYAHDVPEHRHDLVAQIDDIDTPLTRDAQA
jgi:integrase